LAKPGKKRTSPQTPVEKKRRTKSGKAPIKRAGFPVDFDPTEQLATATKRSNSAALAAKAGADVVDR
jgi:hypothetical protein